MKTTILTSLKSFTAEFERCCQQYESLHMAVAWCGLPSSFPAYNHLKNIRGGLKVTIGTAFCQTHPSGIERLIQSSADLRVFPENDRLFHPKTYYFSSNSNVAIFVGSSNLTYSGFHSNHELNILIEGQPIGSEKSEIEVLRRKLKKWHEKSVVPDQAWLHRYKLRHAKRLKKEQETGLGSPAGAEELLPDFAKIQDMSWKDYYQDILKSLNKDDRTPESFFRVFRASDECLPKPWSAEQLDNKDARRVILGKQSREVEKSYGALGHIGASGMFGHFIKTPSPERTRAIELVNKIEAIQVPIEWGHFEELLEKLCELGPTMKVWGRLLALVRPDLFCTVSAERLRERLGKVIGCEADDFKVPSGYVRTIQFMHNSLWFQSPRPANSDEANFWDCRTAFVDALMYELKSE